MGHSDAINRDAHSQFPSCPAQRKTRSGVDVLNKQMRGSDHDPSNDCGHGKKLDDVDNESGHGHDDVAPPSLCRPALQFGRNVTAKAGTVLGLLIVETCVAESTVQGGVMSNSLCSGLVKQT